MNVHARNSKSQEVFYIGSSKTGVLDDMEIKKKIWFELHDSNMEKNESVSFFHDSTCTTEQDSDDSRASVNSTSCSGRDSQTGESTSGSKSCIPNRSDLVLQREKGKRPMNKIFRHKGAHFIDFPVDDKVDSSGSSKHVEKTGHRYPSKNKLCHRVSSSHSGTSSKGTTVSKSGEYQIIDLTGESTTDRWHVSNHIETSCNLLINQSENSVSKLCRSRKTHTTAKRRNRFVANFGRNVSSKEELFMCLQQKNFKLN